MQAVLVGRAISYQSHRCGFESLCRPFFAQQKILALGVIYILRRCLLLSQHCAKQFVLFGDQIIVVELSKPVQNTRRAPGYNNCRGTRLEALLCTCLLIHVYLFCTPQPCFQALFLLDPQGGVISSRSEQRFISDVILGRATHKVI